MAAFPATLRLVLDLDRRRPATTQPAELDRLFQALAQADAGEAAALESRIWAIWEHHSSAGARSRLRAAIAALREGQVGQAEEVLDGLIAAHPDWPEVWSKRGLLRFLAGRDREAVGDLGAALELEPRHFAALSCFGQLCLRHGDVESARIAFDAALRVHPQLRGVLGALERLNRLSRSRVPPSVH